MRVQNGDRQAEPGRLEAPDLRFECRYEDWVDVASGREDPRRAMLTGKVRPKGSLRTLWRSRKLFAI